MRAKFVFLCLAAAMLVLAGCTQPAQPQACTMEAKLCPDGSAVGRVGPNCEFAPCPNCTCPDGYVKDGDVCNPACYYDTPKCLAASIPCARNA